MLKLNIPRWFGQFCQCFVQRSAGRLIQIRRLFVDFYLFQWKMPINNGSLCICDRVSWECSSWKMVLWIFQNWQNIGTNAKYYRDWFWFSHTKVKPTFCLFSMKPVRIINSENASFSRGSCMPWFCRTSHFCFRYSNKSGAFAFWSSVMSSISVAWFQECWIYILLE